jgi:hypothetical protein
MVAHMAEHDDTIEDLEGTHEEPDGDEITEEKVKGWISEAVETVLQRIPGEGTVETAQEEEGEADQLVGATVRQIEDATRRAVEEAMKPLKAAQASKKKAPAKKAAAPKPEPEVSPAAMPSLGMRLRKAMWGDADD